MFISMILFKIVFPDNNSQTNVTKLVHPGDLSLVEKTWKTEKTSEVEANCVPQTKD